MKKAMRTLLAIGLVGGAGYAHAESNYKLGYITEYAFVGDTIVLRINTGVPDNCNSTSYGFMQIPAAYKSMQAYVLSLWFSGEATTRQVMVYTAAPSSTPYCTILQLNPQFGS
jgi:hypothetical protein